MNAQTTESKSILSNPAVTERAILYCRVSTDEQAESGTSIDNQVEKSLAYAATHNLQVVAVFREDYTGKVLDRPELNKCREMLRAGQADNLICYKTNRLDRSEWGLNLLILMSELKQLGVSLHYSQAGRRVDLTNPVEALMESISGWQSGEDHRETVRKLHEGRLARAKSGHVVVHGNPPYGYRAVKEDKRWHLEIDETEGNIVRLIFQWYTVGDGAGQPLSLHGIARRLNEMNVPTRKGSSWADTTVHKIISSETHAGTWYYGKEGKNGKNPKEHYIPVSVEPIVSREVWEVAQERIAYNKQHSRRNRKRLYLLAGRVTCVCQYRMSGTGSVDGTYSYYRCPTKGSDRMKRRECSNPGFPVPIVDSKVWAKLEEVANDREKLIEGLRGYQARQEGKAEPIRIEITYIEELLKEKNAEFESLYADLKVLTSERARVRKGIEIGETEQVIKGLEKRRDDLLTELKGKSLTDEEITGLAQFVQQVAEAIEVLRQAEAEGLDTLELKLAVFEAKRRLLEALNVQVTLFVEDGKKKAEMTAMFCPDGFTIDLGNTKIRGKYSSKEAGCKLRLTFETLLVSG